MTCEELRVLDKSLKNSRRVLKITLWTMIIVGVLIGIFALVIKKGDYIVIGNLLLFSGSSSNGSFVNRLSMLLLCL